MRQILMYMIFFLSSLLCGGQGKVSCLHFEEGTSWDFGRAEEDGGLLVHTYRFKNVSKDTVTIADINTYCKCTGASLSGSTFLPGKTGEIRVTFNPYGYPGKISKSVRVKTIPESDFLLEFSADIIPRKKPVEEEYPLLMKSGLRLDRTDFNFAVIPAGTSKSMVLKCVNTSIFPLTVSVEGGRDGSFFDVKGPGAVSPGEKAEIIMTYSPSLDNIGFRRDTFLVRTGGFPEKVTVTAAVSVTEDFSAVQEGPVPGVGISNSYMNLKEVQAASGDVNISYTIRNIGKGILSVRDIYCPPGLSCSLVPGIALDPGQTRRFDVTLHVSKFPEGKLFCTVKVMTNDPVRPVKDLMIAAKIVD